MERTEEIRPYDVVVVGAGAAGMMAAGTAAQRGCRVLLLEKMEKSGRKVRITGKGRCNVTNARPAEEFAAQVRTNAAFFAPAFAAFQMCEKTEKQHELDKRYLRMAAIWAENSYCKRRQVGALLVKDKMIISDGYNGTPAGFENVCEDENNVTKPYVLHAEANAITKVAASSNSSKGATIYVTSSPCIECAKLIIQSGIKRVVYSENYRIADGCELLKRAGIIVDYIDLNE